MRSIPDKSKLRFLGNCFKQKGEADAVWRIAAFFQVDDQLVERHLRFGFMPYLGLRRQYDRSSVSVFTDNGYRKKFTLPHVDTWREAPLRDCPLIGKTNLTAETGGQNCYRIPVGKTELWVPKLELARTLYFPSAFLARLAFQPSGLVGSFRVNRLPDGVTEIEMLPDTRYPKQHINHNSYRSHLAWLLLNEEARTTFGTIHSCRRRSQDGSGRYIRWTFDFQAPDLTGCELSVLGHFDRSRGIFFVYQITGIRGLNPGIDDEVHFVMQEGYEPGGRNGSQSVVPLPEDEGLVIEDDEARDGDGSTLIAHTPSIEVLFKRDIKTRRVDRTKKAGTMGGADGEDETGVTLRGSVAEGTIAGHVPGADFDQLEDTVDLEDMERKFTQFNKLVDLLEVEPGMEVLRRENLPVHELPRCQLYLNADGTRRRYMHVVVRLDGGAVRHILEVDTSDAKKPLATKILAFSSPDPDAFVEQVMKRMVKQSLRWPSDYLNKECTINRSVNHPRSKVQGLLDKEELAGWCSRVTVYLLR